MFLTAAERWPELAATELQHPDSLESYTYSELRRMVAAIGQWLILNGFPADSRVAILADNHPRWVAAFIGTTCAGCIAVPLDTAFTSAQVRKLLLDSGSAIVFADAKHMPAAQEAAAELGVALVLMNGSADSASARTDLDAIFASPPPNAFTRQRGRDDLAAILYTSGTTADPKGVMLTHGNLLAEVDGVSPWASLGPGDALLGVLPMFHVLALMANLLVPLVHGARVVYLEQVNTTELLRALSDRKITAFAVVPQFFYLIHERIFKEAAKRSALLVRALRLLMSINRALRGIGLNAGRLFFGKVHKVFGGHMRYLVTGGSRFEPQVAQDFHDLGIDLLQAYGLTETTAAAAATSSHDNVIGSVGKPLHGIEARILDPQAQDDGPPAGDILLRGGTVMKGYWNRPDATAEALRDGWLYTGDLGYLDAHGNLFITGRRKEVIILSNGKNVYPEEIEAHYLQSPVIKEICVMALEGKPDDPGSERLHGVIVPNFTALKERKVVNAGEVIRFEVEGLSAKLPSTKRLGSYEIWQDDLPRTTTRKIKRFEVTKRVRAQGVGTTAAPASKPLSAEDEQWLAEPQVARAIALVREASRAKPEVIRPDDNLDLDLGLDSMQRLDLLAEVESELGGRVDEASLADIYTVRDLIEAVRNSAGSGHKPEAIGWSAVLSEDPTDPETLAIAQRNFTLEASSYVVSRFWQMVAQDRFDLHFTGLENIPASGPVLLCSNHQSFLDAPTLASLLPWNVFRRAFAVGTSDIFGAGVMRRVARLLRVIVLDPDANLVSAMRASAYGLRKGGVLILYPEGERSLDGEPKKFKKGAAILSIHLQVPIVPVAIDGFFAAWPRGKSFQRFAPLRVEIGKPILPPHESSEESYQRLTDETKARVMEMWARIHEELQARG
jgi:long-chain acyl-CoA synthetase